MFKQNEGRRVIQTEDYRDVNLAEILLEILDKSDNTELEELAKQLNAMVEKIRDNTDEVEPKLDSVIEVLQTISTNTDGLETALESVNTSLENITTNTDEIETLLNNVIDAINGVSLSFQNPVSVITNDLTKTVEVATGLEENTIIAPEEGKIWVVKNLVFEAPVITGATTGTQDLRLIYGINPTDNLASLHVATEFSKAIDIRQRMDMSDSVVSPPVTDLIGLIENMVVTPEEPLNIKYTNNTDVTQTQLNIFVTVEEKNNV